MTRARLLIVAAVITVASDGCWSDTKEVMGWGRPRWWSFAPIDVALAVGLAALALAALAVQRRRST